MCMQAKRKIFDSTIHASPSLARNASLCIQTLPASTKPWRQVFKLRHIILLAVKRPNSFPKYFSDDSFLKASAANVMLQTKSD